jgi:hypothetical protein
MEEGESTSEKKGGEQTGTVLNGRPEGGEEGKGGLR